MSAKPEARFVPFANGTSFMVWYQRNCDRCWKSKVNEATGKSQCAIENAISRGSVSDGRIKPLIAKRLNWDGSGYLETDCAEREENRPKRKPKQDEGEELFK